MDPYAKVKRALVVRTFVQVAQGLLNLPSAHDSVNSAGELSENTVTCRIGNATTMVLDKPIHDLTVGCDSSHGAHLVLTHKAGVSCDIGRKDRREPSLHPLRPGLHGFKRLLWTVVCMGARRQGTPKQ
jgi:hypothetical protein